MNSYLKNKLISNTLVQSGGKLISALIGFLTVFFLTRHLGVNRYGEFTLVFAYLTLFGVLADFGLHLSMIKELALIKISIGNIIGTYFILRLLLVGISTLISFICLLFIPYSNEIKIAILLASIGVNIGFISGFSNAIFQSELRIDIITSIDLIGKIVTVFFIGLFSLLNLNFYFIVSTVLIGNSVALISSIYFLKKQNKLFMEFNKSIAKKMIKISIPIGITSFFSLLYFKIDTFMLSILKSTSEVAFYGVAYKMFENILMLWGFYMASAYPILSSTLNNKKEFNLFFKKNIKDALFGSIVIVLFFYVLAPYIVKYLAGNNFLESISALKILLLATPFLFVNNIIYHVFLLKEKMWMLVWIFISSLIFNVIINFVIIPKYSFIGTSYTTLATEIFIFFCYLFLFLFNIRKYG